MIGKSSSDTQPVSVSEVLEILETRKKAGELGYEQQLAYDYAKKFAKLPEEKAKKMVKELVDLGLSPKTAVKVADIMPVDLTQLKQVLVIEKKTVEEDVIAKIFAVVESYRGK